MGIAMESYAELIGRALSTNGGHLSIGRGGFTLHYSNTGTLSGHACEAIKAECIARGLPVIDSRDVPIATVILLVYSGPMTAVGITADPPPWHGLSYAPLEHVAETYRAAGAEVFNLRMNDQAGPQTERNV